MTTEKEKLEAAKAAAAAKVGDKKTVTRDTIVFQKNSDSKIVFNVLEKAKKALAINEIEERAVAASVKNPGRVKLVANWFVTNGIATKDDKGAISLVPKTESVEAPVEEQKAA